MQTQDLPITEVPTEILPPESNVILGLKVANIQCLKAVVVVPQGHVVKVQGNNGSGKTSLLNSILWPLTGKRALPEQPIRRGAVKADVEMDMGDYTIRMVISTKTGATITIKGKNGQEFSSPMEFLKGRTNPLLLSPIDFIRLGETPEGRRKQADILRQLVGLDFSQLDAEKKTVYDQRTLVGRDLDTVTGKLKALPFDPAAPAEEQSAADLVAELERVTQTFDQQLEDARTLETQRSTLQQEIKSLTDDSGRCHFTIRAAEEEIERQRQSIAREQQKIAQNEAELKPRRTQLESIVIPNKEQIELDKQAARKPISERISNAETINQKVRVNKRHTELKGEAAKHQKTVADLTNRLQAIEDTKAEQLKGAKYPLAELSFDETGILLNSLPLNQGSQAQQLKAVLAIGFAMKPKIPVALLKDASLFDDNSLAEAAAMAEQAGGQIWMECVESKDPRALVIEAGELVEKE